MYNAEGMADIEPTCILAIDWGSKRIGIAISDPSEKFARPLGVINHTSRAEDAKRIIALCIENSVQAIIMGVTFDEDNALTPNGRSASRLAEEVSVLFGKQVILLDESFTTKDAKQLQLEKGVPRKKRKGHQDELAAVMLLEDYLEKISNE